MLIIQVFRFGVKNLEGKYFEKRGGSLGGNGSNMNGNKTRRWTRYAKLFTACLHEKLRIIKALVAHPGLAVTELQNT